MIVSTPGTLGGKPRIDGRRIAVEHIAVWYYEMGWSVEYMMGQFDLTREQIDAALVYYAAHRDDIDAQRRASEAFIASLRNGEHTCQP